MYVPVLPSGHPDQARLGGLIIAVALAGSILQGAPAGAQTASQSTAPQPTAQGLPHGGESYPVDALRQVVAQIVVLDRAFGICLPDMVDRYTDLVTAEKANGLLEIEPYASQFEAMIVEIETVGRPVECTQMAETAALLTRSPDHLLSFMFRNSACVHAALRALPPIGRLDQETERRVIRIGEACALSAAETAMTAAPYRPVAAGPSPHGPLSILPAFPPLEPPAAVARPQRLGPQPTVPEPQPIPAGPPRQRLGPPPSLEAVAPPVQPNPAPSLSVRPAARSVAASPPDGAPNPSHPRSAAFPADDPFARDRAVERPPARGCQFC